MRVLALAPCHETKSRIVVRPLLASEVTSALLLVPQYIVCRIAWFQFCVLRIYYALLVLVHPKKRDWWNCNNNALAKAEH
jgi:hypothetical protein